MSNLNDYCSPKGMIMGGYYESFWLDLSKILGNMSFHIRNQDKVNVEKEIISTFYLIFNICACFNIDMNKAWGKWRTKAVRKRYHEPKEMRYNDILFNKDNVKYGK